jgi:flagellar basal-body rod protein FlgB
MMGLVDDRTVGMLKQELDHQLRRSELIAANVANIDTPGYKSCDLEFAHALQQADRGLALKTTDPRHIVEGAGAAVVSDAPVQVSAEPGRADGNNVDIDSEMLKLTQTNIQYNIAVQFVSKRLAGIRNAIYEMKR